MKLYKAINEQVPTYSEEELLLMENEILRDELEFQENMRSLELMETVLNCIEQEGEVSKSVEIMFGDSVEDKASFKAELEAAYEVFIKDKFDYKTEVEKLKKIAQLMESKMYEAANYLSKNINKIEFPVYAKVAKGEWNISSITDEFFEMLEKIKSRNVSNMSKEDCRACLDEFEELSQNITRDWKGKYFDKEIVDKETIDDKAEALRFIDRVKGSTKTMMSETQHCLQYIDPFLKSIKEMCEKADLPKSLSTANKICRAMFFLMRQHAMGHLQIISSLLNGMKAQTKA